MVHSLSCYYLVTSLAFTKKPQRNNEALAPTDRPEVEYNYGADSETSNPAGGWLLTALRLHIDQATHCTRACIIMQCQSTIGCRDGRTRRGIVPAAYGCRRCDAHAHAAIKSSLSRI